jgi:acetylornithine deacetylase/succinyl-diaminopimelate desuccinylase-like protein
MGAELERLIEEALPAGAELTLVSRHSAPPAHFPADSPVLQIAGAAIARAVGAPVAYVRSGGAIPFVADLGEKGIPTIVTGFVLPDDPFHAPNESFSVRGLELGYKSARELLTGLAELGS